METWKTTGSLRGLSVSSVVFGGLGGLCYWWVPLGMVFSLTGLLLGFFDWSMASRRSADFRISVFAVILSAVVLALDIFIAARGWQTVTFGSLR